MDSPNTSISKTSKKQKILIIPPKQLFIGLTKDDNTTPSPQPQCSFKAMVCFWRKVQQIQLLTWFSRWIKLFDGDELVEEGC
jgi:hypothetical protein